MQRIHAVVTSSKFWALNSMTAEVAMQCEFLGRWSESCSCHEDSFLKAHAFAGSVVNQA